MPKKVANKEPDPQKRDSGIADTSQKPQKINTKTHNESN
jgi:hypothetical protein